jgi:hypothetical protein
MQFIHTIPNHISKELCDRYIETFDKSKLTTTGKTFYDVKSETNNEKKSTDILFNSTFLDDNDGAVEEGWGDLMSILHPKLHNGIRSYMNEFPEFDTMYTFGLSSYNMQRYLPSEGFYKWHCENTGSPNSIQRCFAWMIYLNDVDDGGTEFLYQNHTEKAEMGKFVIWPAYYTHIHRGQISHTKTKYILTGWYTFFQ